MERVVHLIEARLSEGIQRLETLIESNKTNLKDVRTKFKKVQKKVLREYSKLDKPVTIVQDDVRFFANLFKKNQKMNKTSRRGKSPVYVVGDEKKDYKAISRQRRESVEKLKREHGVISVRDVDYLNKGGKIKKRRKRRKPDPNKSVSKGYLRSMSPQDRLSPDKKDKIAELRPEQFRERFLGVVPDSLIYLDSMNNLRLRTPRKKLRYWTHQSKKRFSSKKGKNRFDSQRPKISKNGPRDICRRLSQGDPLTRKAGRSSRKKSSSKSRKIQNRSLTQRSHKKGLKRDSKHYIRSERAPLPPLQAQIMNSVDRPDSISRPPSEPDLGLLGDKSNSLFSNMDERDDLDSEPYQKVREKVFRDFDTFGSTEKKPSGSREQKSFNQLYGMGIGFDSSDSGSIFSELPTKRKRRHRHFSEQVGRMREQRSKENYKNHVIINQAGDSGQFDGYGCPENENPNFDKKKSSKSSSKLSLQLKILQQGSQEGDSEFVKVCHQGVDLGIEFKKVKHSSLDR